MDRISISDLIVIISTWTQYLRSKIFIIIAFAVVGASIGILISINDKPTYTASLSFAMEDEKSGGGLSGALGLASQFGLDVGGSGGSMFNGDNLLELMKSRKIIEKTLTEPLDYKGRNTVLADLLIEQKELSEKLKDRNGGKKISFFPSSNTTDYRTSFLKDSILSIFHKEILKSNLSVFLKDKKLSIIIVNFKSEDEYFAKIMVEKLTQIVADFYTETKTRKSRVNLDILQHQTDSVRRELNASITGVASFSDNTFNLNPALNVKRAPGQSRQVDVQANTAVLTELIKNLELAKVSLRKETPLFQIIDKPVLPLEMTKIGKRTGVLVGAIFGVLVIIVFLVITKLYKDFINEKK